MTTTASAIQRHEAVHSTWLGAERGVTVYLPRGYVPRPAAPYPVLFLHDGQNLFDPARAHIAGEHWRAAETANHLIRSGRLTPVVLVGIDHGGPDRLADFTPTPGGRAGAGQARRYVRFVFDEVMPLISREYAVRTDAAGIGVGGSSMGGLVTLVMASMQPGRLGRMLLMSPSVWWDKRVILKMLTNLTNPANPTNLANPSVRIWLDVGLKEGGQTIRNARKLRDVLTGAGNDVRYVEDADGDHTERSWAQRFGDALEYLYGPTSPASPTSPESPD